MKKTDYMTIRIDAPLKKKVVALARIERRRLTDQVIFLLEKGLLTLEQQSTGNNHPTVWRENPAHPTAEGKK